MKDTLRLLRNRINIMLTCHQKLLAYYCSLDISIFCCCCIFVCILTVSYLDVSHTIYISSPDLRYWIHGHTTKYCIAWPLLSFRKMVASQLCLNFIAVLAKILLPGSRGNSFLSPSLYCQPQHVL